MARAFFIEVAGTRIELVLDNAADRLKDFRRFWREFWGPQFFGDILQNFKTQGRSVGGWRALNPEYARWKRGIVGRKPILEFHGDMRRSFEEGNRERLFRVTPRNVEAGSKHKKVVWHNRGTGRVPQRKIIFVGPTRVYKSLLDAFVTEELNAAGLRVRGDVVTGRGRRGVA